MYKYPYSCRIHERACFLQSIMHLIKAISHDHACFFCHACFQALMRYVGATVLIVSSYYTCLTGQTSSIRACHARHHIQGPLHTWSDTLPASTPTRRSCRSSLVPLLVETIVSWNYWWGLLQPFGHQEDTNQKVTQCNWYFKYLLNSEPHSMETRYSLVGVATSVYVR